MFCLKVNCEFNNISFSCTVQSEIKFGKYVFGVFSKIILLYIYYSAHMKHELACRFYHEFIKQFYSLLMEIKNFMKQGKFIMDGILIP